MPKTNAERQRDHRQRRTARIAALKTQIAELRAENGTLRTDPAAAPAETERLTSTACRHPAGAVDSGTCTACGQGTW
jgi:hypothetical protein